MKNSIKLLNLLVLLSLNNTRCDIKVPSRVIKNLKEIRKQYKNDPEKLNYYIDLVKEYYDSGSYEKEVLKVCHRACQYFNNLDIDSSKNNAVIFDIDETALSNYELYRSKNLNWGKYTDTDEYRKKAQCKAIKPVLDLYNFLQKKGYKIIFITSRNAKLYNGTYKNLTKEGYKDFETLILLPLEIAKDKSINHSDWKKNTRKELSEKYNIVASISDSEKDLTGGYTGYKIKLPNYLY